MGWLYMQSLRGFPGPRAYLDDQFTYAHEAARSTVLRSALVRMRTYYAAVELLRPGHEREVFALVCLVRYNPRDREGYVFGYKDMNEAMGPCEAECPPAILDLLTPTDRPYALEWRARCRANAARRAAKPKLRAGQIVVFAAPITFTDGTCHDRLEVVIDPRHPRRVLFRSSGGGWLYRVSRFADREYHIEGSASA